MIVPNVIIIWPSTNGSIPSGFVRETSLDGRFPKSYGTAFPDATGGNDTHSHNSPTHTHTMINHTHTYTLPQYSGPTEDEGDGNGGSRFADEVHTHNGTSGAVSGGNISGQATIGVTSSLPPYYDVIFIKATQTTSIPNNGIMLRNDTTVPSGFNFCDGTSGTVNLVNKYLRGAGGGLDAGTTGGSLTHTHTYDHTHPDAVHGHASARSNNSDHGQSGDNQDGSGNGASGLHGHQVGLNNTTTSVNSATGTFTSGTVEPTYFTLRANQNTSGSTKLPRAGDIALWLGTVLNVPIGWRVCDGTNGTPDLRDKYIKISSTVGTTGGSNAHSHSAVASHTHLATGTHNHTGGTGDADDTNMTGVGPHSVSVVNHQHSVTNVSNVTATWNSTTIDCDPTSNEPAYRTVVYIQFVFSLGGSPLLMLI